MPRTIRLDRSEWRALAKLVGGSGSWTRKLSELIERATGCEDCSEAVRRCRGCGRKEKRTGGRTDIAPLIGYCTECISSAMEASDG